MLNPLSLWYLYARPLLLHFGHRHDPGGLRHGAARGCGARQHLMRCRAGRTRKRIDLARAKGRMLLRQQLADQLATLQHDCKLLSADQGSAANIQMLEREIRALRAELEAAEEQLRKLKGDASR